MIFSFSDHTFHLPANKTGGGGGVRAAGGCRQFGMRAGGRNAAKRWLRRNALENDTCLCLDAMRDDLASRLCAERHQNMELPACATSLAFDLSETS